LATLSPDEHGINRVLLDPGYVNHEPTAEHQINQDRSEVAPAKIVCLVDDELSVRKSVSRLLESAGFSVRAFAKPEVFLEYLAKNPVPVVVLDIWMESMTGMELLAHLCARSPDTRVIFITGHEDHAARATVMQGGAFAFLIKPLDDRQFLSEVHRALGIPPEKKRSSVNEPLRKPDRDWKVSDWRETKVP
jgi:FixJ family two-component response regulator